MTSNSDAEQTIDTQSRPAAVTTTGTPAGVHQAPPIDTVLRVERASSRIGETVTLRPTSFSVGRGQIVAIAGGSGAGKTTLLETIAGVRAATTGEVVRAVPSAFVPQDDIIHRELPLRRTLLHAAALRIVDRDAVQRARSVDRVLRKLGLHEYAEVRVGDLSGGQRKRASIASEMLTDARLLFLDEPTSGLDPANGAGLMQSLRQLADAGSTVVLTTHSPADLARCDRVVFVANGGQVAFVGTPSEAKGFFAVEEMADIYPELTDWPFDRTPGEEVAIETHSRNASEPQRAPRAPTGARQWRALVRRNLDLIASNRLTVAILAGSPAFIIATMTMLFPAGAFESSGQSSTLAVQTLFWLAFNSFFFGLTYGLLQIVGEFEIVRRERRIGLSIGAYVASKLSILVPMLAVVNAAQIVVMERTGRLPDLTLGQGLGVFASLQLLSTAAVAAGLHASSMVKNSTQATLALPMLCFPQVLFAGAVVPVTEMGPVPRAMSAPLASRWGFESLGRVLEVGPISAGEPGTGGLAKAFSGTHLHGWLVLGLLIVVGTAATMRTLARRT